jgi:hypothetical protein
MRACCEADWAAAALHDQVHEALCDQARECGGVRTASRDPFLNHVADAALTTSGV